MLDQREADWDAYNAALLLTLGALGARRTLHALLAEAAPRGAPERADEDTLHAVLGLIAALDRVAAHAATLPPRSRPPERAAPPPPPGLLR